MPRDMGRFWDRRAAENAFYFVDTRLDYRQPDLDRFWAQGERDLDALLDALGARLEPEDRVLEIGCGVGRLTRVLARRAGRVWALDVSARMLELAAEHNPELDNVQWLLGDGCTLNGIETAGVDVCISHVVFQHLPDPELTLGYIREIGRVLAPAGWAAFQISNDPRLHRPLATPGRVRRAAAALIRRGPHGQGDPRWRGSPVALSDVRRAAAEGGLAVERVVGEGTQMCCVLVRRHAEQAAG